MTLVLGFLVAMAFWVWALLDCLGTPPTRIRRFSKLTWLCLILIFSWAGAAAWLWLARPRRPARVDPWGQFEQTTRVPRGRPDAPIGPDDDPDFLSRI